MYNIEDIRFQPYLKSKVNIHGYLGLDLQHECK